MNYHVNNLKIKGFLEINPLNIFIFSKASKVANIPKYISLNPPVRNRTRQLISRVLRNAGVNSPNILNDENKKEVETNKDGGIVDLVAFLKKGGTIKHLNKW